MKNEIHTLRKVSPHQYQMKSDLSVKTDALEHVPEHAALLICQTTMGLKSKKILSSKQEKLKIEIVTNGEKYR